MSKPPPTTARPRRKREPIPELVADALRQVLAHVWTTQQRSFVEKPEKNHLFLSVVVCDRWLNRVAPEEQPKSGPP